jgi:hypothetical protein
MYLQQRESENYFLHLCYALILSFANIGCWPSPGDIHPREYRTRDVMIEIRHIASGYPKTQGLEGVGALLEIESVGELVEAARRARLVSVRKRICSRKTGRFFKKSSSKIEPFGWFGG